jgi:uncharacterized membrane protein YccC
VSEQPTKEDLNMPGDRTSKELVKSLRDYSEGPTFYWGPICQKAAEEIERLQRELAASAAQYQEACDDANRFARERDEARASSEPATEHPPQLMAVVDKWQDLANRWRELTPRRDREDAALVELILREIRETIAPSSSVTKGAAQ